MPRYIDVIDRRLDPQVTEAVGWIRGELVIPITLPIGGTGAYAIVTAYAPGFVRIIESATVFVNVAGTGVGASRDLNVKKGSTTVATGTLTLANMGTPGASVALTVTPAVAEFLDADTLTVDFTAGGTTFTAGSVNLVIKYRTRPQQVS